MELAPALPVQAAWHANPSTRSAPLAIAAPDGPVEAVCPLAAAAGVMQGQSVTQARLRCPDVAIVPPDGETAPVLWEEMLAALSGISPIVEAADPVAGVAYLDARGMERLWGDAAAVADAALRALAGQGLAARAGAGPTRVVALALAQRMGASGPRALDGAGARSFLRALPAADPVLGLPPAAADDLRLLGITTAGHLATLPPAGLEMRFGPDALAAWRRAAGEDEPPLQPWAIPPRLSSAYHTEDGLADTQLLSRLLAQLSADLAAQLAGHGQAAATLTLDLRCEDGARHIHRTRTWPPLSIAPALHTAALDLLSRARLTAPAESAALHATDLCQPEAHQIDLWGERTAAERRRARLGGVLAAQARRHGRDLMRRVQPDALAEDGWAWLDLEPAKGPAPRGPAGAWKDVEQGR